MQVAIVRRFACAYAQRLIIVVNADGACSALLLPAHATLGTAYIVGRRHIFRPVVGLPLAVMQVKVI